MITSLELQNYRGFRQYKLDGLARVNLLVGKNNSGKTSVLEAIHLLVRKGDVGVLQKISYSRGEMGWLDFGRKAERSRFAPRVSHFFFGHEIGRDSSFAISADQAEQRLAFCVTDPTKDDLGAISQELPDNFQTKYFVEIHYKDENHIPPLRLPASKEGWLFYDQKALLEHAHSMITTTHGESGLSRFIATDSLERSALAGLWDEAIRESQESEVIEAMRLLEPELQNIVFLTGDRSFPNVGNTGGILLGVQGKDRRIPLGSYGEGMRRLLALSLVLAQSKGGCLLIDEIDTGLHYSIMGDLWNFIVQAARRFDVQVFATTHSWDCIRGLAWLCDNYPDLGSEVSLQKIEPRLAQSVDHNAEQILIAADLGIEVR